MSPSDKVNILVVDDVPDKLLAMQAILDELDQNVVAVRSGREALRALLDQEFAVILLDVNMPDMDGFETAALIRQRKKSEHTPIIFVTAFFDETHAGQGYSLGAVDYILAPVIPEVLRTKVSVFVDLYRKNLQIKQQADQRVAFAQEQAARIAAEALTRRTEFLADASSQLARTLDFEATIAALMNLLLHNVAHISGLVLLDERTQTQSCEVRWLETNGTEVTKVQISLEKLPAALTTSIDNAVQSEKPLLLDSIEFNQFPRPAVGTNGTSFCCASLAVLPLVARGKTIGVLWFGHRQTPRNEFNLALAEALAGRAAIAIDNARLYRKVQEGDRRKDEFLAMLGHELRNPLAAISNALECLRLSKGDEQLSLESQGILVRQVQQMSRLVDDLLDVSRITQGKVELRKEVVDLASVVRRAVTVTSSMVSARLHQLSVSMPPGPLLLYADPTRVEQILANLINNATKYTEPEGKISLVVERQQEEIVIRVIDNGIGIPETLLPQIFELFTQGDRSLDRSQGGLGIGLTLVQRLVEMHGGKVTAKSRGLHQGAEFVVRLPEYHADTLPTKLDRTSGGTVDPSSIVRRILLVDDNEDLAYTMSMLLKRVGHDVRAVNDGLTSLEAAAAWQPDIMLIDIGLPGLDGYEVAKRIREQHSSQEMVLIAMTGYGQAEDRHRSQQAGFDHHLVKPVAFDELQRVLSRCESRSVVVSGS